ASVIYDIPFGLRRSYGAHLPRALNAIAGDWTVTAIATMATGFPIFITSPNQTTSIYPNERPNRVCNGADSSLSGNLRTDGFVDFDTSCFVTPAFGYFGNSARAPLFGPGQNNWDIAILKNFPVPLGEAGRLEFRAELFNAFNHAQFNNPNGNTGSVNFGVISSAQSPRLVQLALKLMW
ncbi:MAG: carboxypeptidase regulatory-like domain-containing protein, partial [Ktedonobacteraceae bacterium]